MVRTRGPGSLLAYTIFLPFFKKKIKIKDTNCGRRGKEVDLRTVGRSWGEHDQICCMKFSKI